ncbi:sensor histidine kinase [Prosthecobacter sp.]|uniref:sensor histidine kinase n=1 Tax=Prosthecobacter sp. TaxID=1965333 RepID=UPI003784DABB
MITQEMSAGTQFGAEWHSGRAAAVLAPMCVQDDCRLFGALLNESHQGILVVDEGDVVVFVNLAMNVMFLPHQLEVGGTLGSAAGLEALVRLVNDSRKKRSRVEADLRFTLPYLGAWNHEHHYHLCASPWSEGGRSGTWVMVEDRTEHRLNEQTRRDFVTSAGHELRTPLSLIHGYIETLKSGMIKNTQSLVRCLDVMDKHSRRMMRIIDDMLTLSRLEGVDEPLRTEAFLVRGCVQDALEHLTPLIEVRQPVITLDFPPDGGLLTGERFYWDQIFTNLIENALKENPRSGLRLHICGRWTKNECILTVEDDGVGIAAEDAPFVFRRFYRCASERSQESKGSGLGLSIVKRAVEAHGGSIELESQPGRRTVFTLRVPLTLGE